MAYQMYRSTTLGDALQKTLDELIQVQSSLICCLLCIMFLAFRKDRLPHSWLCES